MPLIEFKCTKCGKVHQVLVPKEKEPTKCDCGGFLKKLQPKGYFTIN
jgi:putative FmdB family regulatory protein